MPCAREETGRKKVESKARDCADDDMAEHRGPLGGGSYVVSGQFRDITREKLEEFIKKNGGNLMPAVNRKTDYLVVGHILDDGRQPHEGKKSQMAVKLGKKILTESEFEAFCKVKFQDPDFLLGRKTKKDAIAGSADHFISGIPNKDTIGDVMDISDLLNGQNGSAIITPTKPSQVPSYGFSTSTLNVKSKDHFQQGSTHSTSSTTPQKQEVAVSSDLWVEKYAPTCINDLVGNKGVMDSLYEWLKDWDDVVFKGLKKQVFCQRGKSYQDLPRVNARACMLSGPPGIGKSSAAKIIAKELGFSVL